MSLKESIDDFLSHMYAVRNVSEHTVRNYRLDLQKMCTFFETQEKTDVQAIDRVSLRQFVAHLFDSKVSKSTISRHISSIRSFFEFLEKKKQIIKNPTLDLYLPKREKKIPNILSKEELHLFLAQPDLNSLLGLRDRTIMELIFSSGLRLNEAAQINREDIDFQQHLIKIRGKGKKERIVPITPQAQKFIEMYLNSKDRYEDTSLWKKEDDHLALFLNRWGRRITCRSIDRTFKEYVKGSGLARKLTPHVLRHTIATNLLENGMDIKTIQYLLGHSTSQATTIYTHVSKSLKKKIYDASHPRAHIEPNKET